MSQADIASAGFFYLPHYSTSEILQQELADTERALNHCHPHPHPPNENDFQKQDDDTNVTTWRDPYAELALISQTADELLLAKDVAAWMTRTQDNSGQDDSNNNNDDNVSLTEEAKKYQRLGQILRKYKPTGSVLYQNLYEGEFLPMMEYLQSMLLQEFRTRLRQAGYPSLPACGKLLEEYENDHDCDKDGGMVSSSSSSLLLKPLIQAAVWLYRLQIEQDQVMAHVQNRSLAPRSTTEKVVLELCRPFVERIRHHFVVHFDKQQQRVDRLPEWLFEFVRQNIFPQEEDGPWDLIHYVLQPAVRPGLSVDFINEVIQCIQYVLGGPRHPYNLFRHAQLTGPHSQPALLCRAIEQLLQFDDFILNQVIRKNGPALAAGRVLSLMDIYVAADDELMQWWMEREREAVFDLLFFGNLATDNKNKNHRNGNSNSNTAVLLNRVSPRAELFCSLLRSVRKKASCFAFSGPYLNQVAAPLCMQFLDAVHDSATDLKAALFSKRSKLPTAAILMAHVREWMQLINGMHMSAQMLLLQSGDDDDDDDEGEYEDDEQHHQQQHRSNYHHPHDNASEGEEYENTVVMTGRAGQHYNNVRQHQQQRSTAYQDMMRFGQSLERLEQVFVEEFATSFVETLLLEKAKLLSYLMRCSHMLASDDDPNANNEKVFINGACRDLSPDLSEAQYLLSAFLDVTSEEGDDGDDNGAWSSLLVLTSAARSTAFYGARALRHAVLDLLATKFLEVALDWHGTMPTIAPPRGRGALQFKADVQLLLGESTLLPPQALRLLDVMRCLSMDAAQLSVMGHALLGLAGQVVPPLTEDAFEIDERVLEEAMSMIRAKNLLWIHLGDFLSIFNRRMDLSHMSAF